jgi:hypothetical protein
LNFVPVEKVSANQTADEIHPLYTALSAFEICSYPSSNRKGHTSIQISLYRQNHFRNHQILAAHQSSGVAATNVNRCDYGNRVPLVSYPFPKRNRRMYCSQLLDEKKFLTMV